MLSSVAVFDADSSCWFVAPAAAASSAFYETWGDGRGEVSTYDLREERYHEVRAGHAVLVFVTEEMNARTHVKVESERTPEEDRVYVIKLNSLRKFTTGLYDYSTMTSTFCAVEPRENHGAFQPLRVTHSTQEWCGQFWQRLDLEPKGWNVSLRSYFESEGDRETTLPDPNVELEDALWVKIRELDGPFLAPGESVTLPLVPALWELRKTHHAPAAQPVVLRKRDPDTLTGPFGTKLAQVWTWEVGERQVTVWVEADGERRILKWADSNGGRADLLHSERVPYWQLNDDHADSVRRRFLLPTERMLPPVPGGAVRSLAR